MKKIVFTLYLAAALVACKTGEKKPVSNPTAANQAKTDAELPELTTIQWLDSTFINIGKVNDGKVVEVAYRFKNTGKNPLIFSEVRATCGCTVPKKPEQPIAPGEEGEIIAQFDSKGRKGENRKTVHVIANTEPTANYTLEFSVSVQ